MRWIAYDTGRRFGPSEYRVSRRVARGVASRTRGMPKVYSRVRWILLVLPISAAIWAGIPVVACGAQSSGANSTILGPNVFVFDPTMPAADVERAANDIFAKMEKNHFGSERYALLFKPGTYKVNFNVGFYTHVAGLGQSPDDVHIDGGVTVNAKWDPNGNALNNFWRTLENFAVTPSSNVPYKTTKGVTRIAISQAAPLRRLHVKGELQLFDWGPKGTWATPAAGSWPTRSWTARSSPPRSSSGSPAIASGPTGATPCGTWYSSAATIPPVAPSRIRPTPWWTGRQSSGRSPTSSWTAPANTASSSRRSGPTPGA